MGAFYGSLQVRSDDQNAVSAAAENVARTTDTRCLIWPAINGWVGVYPNMNGQDERVGAAIAAQISADVLHMLVHDDGVFAYWFYRGRQLVDSFWSLPGYFGDENLARDEAMSGNPETFRPIVGDRVNRVAKLLVRGEQQELSATELLEEFAKVLNISNAVSAYEYLKDGEREGIKKWKQFKEVPAERVAAAAQTARQLRKEVELGRKRLKADGLLLVHDERKEQQRPYGCAFENGFIVAWADHGADTVEFTQFRSPWGEGRVIGLETSKPVTDLASDAAQRRLAVAAGDHVHVFEFSGDERSRVADVPEEDLAMAVALSADGKFVAHASREQITVTELGGRSQICVASKPGIRNMAFHPDGEWLAIADGGAFGLVSLQSKLAWREIYVGGKKGLTTHSAHVSFELQRIDLVAMERLQRTEMEKLIKKLQKAGARGKQPAMSDADIQRFRESMEKSIEETKTRIADWKEGRAPETRPQSREQTWSVGFSRDGRWLWCGGIQGIRVYEWKKVPRDPGSELIDSTWKVDLPGDPSDPNRGNRVWAIAEEVGSPAIVFSGSGGSLYRFDLESGAMRELIQLPGDAWVCDLAMAADGSTLGIMVGTTLFTEAARKRGERKWAREVWSYPKLCDLK